MPSLTLPKGGGAIRGIDEKFSVNPLTGTSSFSIPIFSSPGRSGFGPQLTLSYDSGSGNGPFGLGWTLSLPSISRKTDLGIPRYRDEGDSDTFLLSGAEDLVPGFINVSGRWEEEGYQQENWVVRRYRPRTEGLFARIEFWRDVDGRGSHWRVLSKDGVENIYGRSSDARVSDPEDPRRVHRWLLEQSADEKGNLIRYLYKAEDGEGFGRSEVFEKNRLGHVRTFSQRYLKRVLYGNRVRQPESDQDWCFELVFDYGDESGGSWPVRVDPFSTYRPGFEVRTYRLCQRVLMFHRFDELRDGERCLVFSTEFDHKHDPIATTLRSVKQVGHVWDGTRYQSKETPSLEFRYSGAEIREQPHYLNPKSYENLPRGVDDRIYQWVDLYGEGLPGVLSEQGGAWHYKANRADGILLPSELVRSIPGSAGFGSRQFQFADLNGGGELDYLAYGGETPGYFRREDSGEWQPLVPFAKLPSIALDDPNLRFVDVNGDGRADLLISEDDVFGWYPADGKNGFGDLEHAPKPRDEEIGPALVFSDQSQSVYLADMSGDGLSDIVRIRNGEICYWPNLGYGKFGAKVTMARSPRFDHPDQFSHERIRLVDVTGSGTTDIIYLGRSEIRIWHNESGNSWSDQPHVIRQFPAIDRLSSVSAIDLLGSGTACLVWSSPLPSDSGAPLAYIELYADGKPYLLRSWVNNLGLEHSIEYAPSTRFYLQDLRAGKPWVTRLPFPVQVVVKSTAWDRVTHTKHSTTYSYHHGYYDLGEREFRGFGRVEQLDTEVFEEFSQGSPDNADRELHMAPVRTVTWAHTGAYEMHTKIMERFRSEYYAGDPQAAPIETPIPDGPEACRALRGRVLRREVYGLDGTDQSACPYGVSEFAYDVRLVQPKLVNRHAVYLSLERETLMHHYERNAVDPRIQRKVTLETDPYGLALRGLSISYPRRVNAGMPEQMRPAITLSESHYVHKDGIEQPYRIGIPVEVRSYEIVDPAFDFGVITSRAGLNSRIASLPRLTGEDTVPSGPFLRLVEHEQVFYFADDLINPLPLGQVGKFAIAFEGQKLMMTEAMRQQVYGDEIDAAEMVSRGGYRSRDGGWWIPSGTQYPDPDRFFLPIRARDAFGNVSLLYYDRYALLPEKVLDPIGNSHSVVNNYRVLRPEHSIDANDNRSRVEFDALGMITATYIMGKESFGEGDPEGSPSIRMTYDLFRWKDSGLPTRVLTETAESHGAGNRSWQRLYSYSDGSGHVVMHKHEVEPGPARVRGDDGRIVEVQCDPRWVGTGRVVFNNKGKPVKQFEAYFSGTAEFESDLQLTQVGVSSVIHYDPLGRAVRKEMPDGTFYKVDFTPWRQITWDANDTVLESRWWRERGAGARAAELASRHAGTPVVSHLDSLGRIFRVVADNGNGSFIETSREIDIQGNPLVARDALGRAVETNRYNLLGEKQVSDLMDAGSRKVIKNAAGKYWIEWTAGGRIETDYDALQRPVKVELKIAGAKTKVVGLTRYGESLPDAADRNLRGHAFELFDSSGVTRNERFDFKGNPLRVTKRFCAEYRDLVDWPDTEAEREAHLAEGEFSIETEYDALNRPIRSRTPDGSSFQPTYTRNNALKSNLLELPGGSRIQPVRNVTYNAKGQRESIAYGNGVQTEYLYDPLNFRLSRLRSFGGTSGANLQDLHYDYDPVGNIVERRDDAQRAAIYDGAQARPQALYVYDALYRLVEATGREHVGVSNSAYSGHSEVGNVVFAHPNDVQAVRPYRETYQYDSLGNLLELRHSSGSQAWTRAFGYDSPESNRLTHSNSDVFDYDPWGNLIRMPHLEQLAWDINDRLRMVRRGEETTYYVYDSQGRRVRKVTEKNGQVLRERFYLPGFEIFRSGEIERTTLTIADDKKCVLMVETDESGSSRLRYQLGDHLDSTNLEADESGKIITYEEYYPYGGTSYRAATPDIRVSAKRYRYAGKERDDESGLYYYGSRYYAPWLGRWISCDPTGISDGLNLYQFVRGNPVGQTDPTGLASKPAATPGTSGSYCALGPRGPDAIAEHCIPGALLELLLSKLDGSSNYTYEEYRKDVALVWPKAAALLKNVKERELFEDIKRRYLNFEKLNLFDDIISPFKKLMTEIHAGLKDKQGVKLEDIERAITEQAKGIWGVENLEDTKKVTVRRQFRNPKGYVYRRSGGKLTAVFSVVVAFLLMTGQAQAAEKVEKHVAQYTGSDGAEALMSIGAEAYELASDMANAAGGWRNLSLATMAGMSTLKGQTSMLIRGAGTQLLQGGQAAYQALAPYASRLMSLGRAAAGAVTMAEALTIGLAIIAVGWAIEDTRRAWNGEKTMREVATETWSQLGFVGTMKEFWFQFKSLAD